ncbi:putative F-box protein [Drosera capensis]
MTSIKERMVQIRDAGKVTEVTSVFVAIPEVKLMELPRTTMASLMIQDDEFCCRILSRNSTIGCSSRVYYYNGGSEGVPFEWEEQPGKAIHPPERDGNVLPPLSPPPAIQSLSFPKPCFFEEPGTPRRMISSGARLFWKRMIKGKKLEFMSRLRTLKGYVKRDDRENIKRQSVKFSESDRGFEVPWKNSRSSSLSTLGSSLDGTSLHPPMHHCWSPKKIMTAMLFVIAKALTSQDLAIKPSAIVVSVYNSRGEIYCLHLFLLEICTLGLFGLMSSAITDGRTELSLVRFQCVCKSWRDLIKSRNFALDHYRYTISRNDEMLLATPDRFRAPACGFYSMDPIGRRGPVQLKLPSSVHIMRDSFVCNGLICICTSTHNFIVWNPVIDEFSVLPLRPSVRSSVQLISTCAIGFGLVHNTNDFVVVGIPRSITYSH